MRLLRLHVLFEVSSLWCLVEGDVLPSSRLACSSLEECKDEVLEQTRVTLVDVCVLVFQINKVVNHVVDNCIDSRGD